MALNLAATAAQRDAPSVHVDLSDGAPIESELGEDLSLDRPSDWPQRSLEQQVGWLQDSARRRDLLLADLGTGAAAVPLGTLADYRVFVLHPQKSSLEGAYALAKTMLWRALRATAIERDALEVLEDAEARSPGGKVPALLRRVRERDPALATAMQACARRLRCGLLGNSTRNMRDANVLYACARVIKDFLRVPVEVLGHVYHDASLSRPQSVPLGARSTRGSDVGVLMGVVRTVLSQGEKGAAGARTEWQSLLPAMDRLAAATAPPLMTAGPAGAVSIKPATDQAPDPAPSPVASAPVAAQSSAPSAPADDPLAGMEFEAVSPEPDSEPVSGAADAVDDPLAGMEFEAVTPDTVSGPPDAGLQFEAVTPDAGTQQGPEASDDLLGGMQFEEVPNTEVMTAPSASAVDADDLLGGITFESVGGDDPTPAADPGDGLLGADDLADEVDDYGRRHDRFVVNTTAMVTVNGGPSRTCTCVDISQGGVSLTGLDNVHDYDHLVLEFVDHPGLTLRATIRHTAAERVGAQWVHDSAEAALPVVEAAREADAA